MCGAHHPCKASLLTERTLTIPSLLRVRRCGVQLGCMIVFSKSLSRKRLPTLRACRGSPDAAGRTGTLKDVQLYWSRERKQFYFQPIRPVSARAGGIPSSTGVPAVSITGILPVAMQGQDAPETHGRDAHATSASRHAHKRARLPYPSNLKDIRIPTGHSIHRRRRYPDHEGRSQPVPADRLRHLPHRYSDHRRTPAIFPLAASPRPLTTRRPQ